MRINDARLLAELDGQLPLGLGHLAPEFLQVRLNGGVVGFFAQGQRKPAIGSRQIMRRAQSGRVERAHFNHGLRITLIGGRL